MAIARVSSVLWQSPAGGGTATSSAIDTTGATLLVIGLVNLASGSPTVSDSKGNTWTPLTDRIGGNSERARLYYAGNPVVGSGHTFAINGTSIFAGAVAAAYSGTLTSSVLEEENGVSSASPVQPGSVTPDQDGSLVVTATYGNVGASINQSFSVVGSADVIGGQAYGISLADLIQTTAASVNPTWTVSNSVPPAVIAVFKPAAGGGGETADIEDAAEFGDSFSARVIVHASITAGIEAADSDAALADATASISAGVTSDAQFDAIESALAAITAGLAAGEEWASIAAASATLTAGAAFGATFTGDTDGATSAAIEAGTEHAAAFLAALQAFASLTAGVTASSSFAALGAAAASLTAGVVMGDAFSASSSGDFPTPTRNVLRVQRRLRVIRVQRSQKKARV